MITYLYKSNNCDGHGPCSIMKYFKETNIFFTTSFAMSEDEAKLMNFHE